MNCMNKKIFWLKGEEIFRFLTNAVNFFCSSRFSYSFCRLYCGVGVDFRFVYSKFRFGSQMHTHTRNQFTVQFVRLLRWLIPFVVVVFSLKFFNFFNSLSFSVCDFDFSIHWNKKTTKIRAHIHTHTFTHSHTFTRTPKTYITDCYYCYVRRGAELHISYVWMIYLIYMHTNIYLYFFCNFFLLSFSLSLALHSFTRIWILCNEVSMNVTHTLHKTVCMRDRYIEWIEVNEFCHIGKWVLERALAHRT